MGLAVLLAFLPARADERGAVELVLGGPSERVQPVEVSLSELLGRLPVAVRITRSSAIEPRSVVEPGGEAGAAAIRVWVDLSGSSLATLYFTDAAWERILIRRVALTRELDEVEREEIAQIVRSAVEALLGGAKIGISRDAARAELLRQPVESPEVRPPAREVPVELSPPPPAPPHADSEWNLSPGAFYEAQVYRTSLWQGPGLSLDLATRSALAFGGVLSLQYRAPIVIEGEALGARLSAAALRALGEVALQTGSARLGAAVGPGLDLTYVEPVRAADRGSPGDASFDAVPVLRLRLGAAWLLPSVELGLLGGVDADWVQVRHVAVRDGGEYTVFSAPRVRPFLALAVQGRRAE
ncbi:MAG: hypothetical protein IPI67_22635 [Myxococcales bacterium]|nr:hypothetical protein [Myxococcales bacterium]